MGDASPVRASLLIGAEQEWIAVDPARGQAWSLPLYQPRAKEFTVALTPDGQHAYFRIGRGHPVYRVGACEMGRMDLRTGA